MRARSLLTAFAVTAGAMLASLSPVSADATGDDVTTNIVNGRNATQVYSFMVSMQRTGGGHFCGGSLIKPNWVVTAQHCVEGKSPGSIQTRIGTTNRNTGGTVARVAQIIEHQSADLALVRLATSVPNAPIQIAPESGAFGTPTRIIGWGQTCPAGSCGAPVILQELDTSIVPDSRCRGIRAASEVCTDNNGGRSGACYGDSGGPEVKSVGGRWQLIGATSRSGGGSRCAEGPSIYVDVPYFRSWIASHAGGV